MKISKESFKIAYSSWRHLFFESESFKELMHKWKVRYESGEVNEELAGKSIVEAASMAAKVGHKLFKTNNSREPNAEEKMEINDAVELVQEFITHWSQPPTQDIDEPNQK